MDLLPLTYKRQNVFYLTGVGNNGVDKAGEVIQTFPKVLEW